MKKILQEWWRLSQGGRVLYLQKVMEEENRKKWKEAEGRNKMAILYSWGEVTTVMGPVSTSPPTPFTVTALSGFGSAAKIQLFQDEAVRSFAGSGRFCLTALSSDWQNGPAAGWRVAGVKWYWRFQHIMAVLSKTSQEIVGYWLFGGDASGLLWSCLKYDELAL